MKASFFRSLTIALATTFMCLTAVNAEEIAGECGPQQTPEETWKAWHESYVSGEWKRWFECHDEGARAGLFLNAAISTPDSEGKTRVIEKYGRCESRNRASLECVKKDTVADFFHEMTVIDERSSRSRLSKIWKKEGVRVDRSKLVAVKQQNDDKASGEIQSEGSDGELEKWTMTFVRVDGRWFVTFKWGM